MNSTVSIICGQSDVTPLHDINLAETHGFVGNRGQNQNSNVRKKKVFLYWAGSRSKDAIAVGTTQISRFVNFRRQAGKTGDDRKALLLYYYTTFPVYLSIYLSMSGGWFAPKGDWEISNIQVRDNVGKSDWFHPETT